ncbi:MAG TPA: pilus assembly protein [Oligoflexia bacterium]|nr:pilus assembly protein [Oligoflexia bacterium]HMP26616.1 pilus assembly protein [Oligoflexia bacterium]
MLSKISYNKCKKEDLYRVRGASLIELAIILPLLFLFIAATITFGRVLEDYNFNTPLVYEGILEFANENLPDNPNQEIEITIDNLPPKAEKNHFIKILKLIELNKERVSAKKPNYSVYLKYPTIDNKQQYIALRIALDTTLTSILPLTFGLRSRLSVKGGGLLEKSKSSDWECFANFGDPNQRDC